MAKNLSLHFRAMWEWMIFLILFLSVVGSFILRVCSWKFSVFGIIPISPHFVGKLDSKLFFIWMFETLWKNHVCIVQLFSGQDLLISLMILWVILLWMWIVILQFEFPCSWLSNWFGHRWQYSSLYAYFLRLRMLSFNFDEFW